MNQKRVTVEIVLPGCQKPMRRTFASRTDAIRELSELARGLFAANHKLLMTLPDPLNVAHVLAIKDDSLLSLSRMDEPDYDFLQEFCGKALEVRL